MTNTQMVFALLIPTITVLVGIIVNNGRFNAMDTRLLNIDSQIGSIRERLAKLEAAPTPTIHKA